MNLKSITLNEKCQTQKATQDSLYMISGKDKSYSDGKQIVTEPPPKIQFVCPMH